MQANQANVTFNTHEALKALKSSGFDEKQAESVVETINKAVNETVATKADLALLATKEELGTLADKMATKDDIKDMATKSDLKVQGAKIEALRETVEGIKENIDKNMATKADLKAEISSLETRMMRMMWLQLMAMLGMFVTMVVALT